jgi:5-methyltetrahydrofolate--homocysteine methyltransferase
VIFKDEDKKEKVAEFRFLRNQQTRESGASNLCLADFIAPVESGKTDYFGAFAVTSGIGLEQAVKAYEDKLDDYGIIMLKILSDRLAEAFAEHLHERIRKEFWGYAPDEDFDLPSILREEYIGIRPAPGYPACPEHSEKRVIFDWLNVEESTGIKLTENFAMYPAASVSGFYFAHPLAQYFNVGRIGKDQVIDYAARKGVSLLQAEKWLSPYLNYPNTTE